MRNLLRITNYYNRLEAWRDWEAILQKASSVPVDVIAKIAPKPESGWRKIDKAIAKLREEIEKQSAPAEQKQETERQAEIYRNVTGRDGQSVQGRQRLRLAGRAGHKGKREAVMDALIVDRERLTKFIETIERGERFVILRKFDASICVFPNGDEYGVGSVILAFIDELKRRQPVTEA